jgi:signal transduction histidine kinase
VAVVNLRELRGAKLHPPSRASAATRHVPELVVASTADGDVRCELARLADEQAALRRVAMLVAREASQAEVFNAIAEEIGRMPGVDECRMLRFEDDGTALVVSGWGDEAEAAFSIGSRLSLDADDAASRVYRTREPARIDDYRTVPGPVAEGVRAIGMRSVVGTPVLVEGRVWGAVIVGTRNDQPPPPQFESRLSQFTELIATTVANTESRARADRLAEEQAALRRVATLVAQGASLPEVHAKVAEAASHTLGNVDCGLWRFDDGDTATLVAVMGSGPGAGIGIRARMKQDGDSAIERAHRHGRPARVSDYSTGTGNLSAVARELGIRSSVVCPIIVGGRAWGATTVVSYDDTPFPPDVESRLGQFSELVATAIGNAEARAEVARLAEEQAALRRVATVVAQGAAPGIVFDAVAAEVAALLDADHSGVCRFEPGAELAVLAHRGPAAPELPAGSRISHEGDCVEGVVYRTHRCARSESYEGARGVIAEMSHALGIRSAVAAPVAVDGRLWGVISSGWNTTQLPPPGTEGRMAQFAQLLATAIANADGREQLIASRARLLDAGDEARRRVVRDLHDGAQQRLVHTVVTLKLARRAAQGDDARVASIIEEALGHAEQANDELRTLAHGILPAVLSRGGLASGVRALVARLDLDVGTDVPAERFPAGIEASAYFIVAEALTNVVKHADATRADVTARAQDGVLQLEIRDDGTGGADPEGQGLLGLADRAMALGGRLEVESPAGDGTRLIATLPLAAIGLT